MFVNFPSGMQFPYPFSRNISKSEMIVVKNIYDVANMHAPFTENKLFEDEKRAVVVEIIW